MDISSDVIRGYNDTIILSILMNGPSYGYEISKEIKRISDSLYVIKETTLYSAFSRLEKNGYIIAFEDLELSGGKKRTYYKITDVGMKYYLDKCEEWKLINKIVERFVIR